MPVPGGFGSSVLSESKKNKKRECIEMSPSIVSFSIVCFISLELIDIDCFLFECDLFL